MLQVLQGFVAGILENKQKEHGTLHENWFYIGVKGIFINVMEMPGMTMEEGASSRLQHDIGIYSSRPCSTCCYALGPKILGDSPYSSSCHKT